MNKEHTSIPTLSLQIYKGISIHIYMDIQAVYVQSPNLWCIVEAI